MFEQMLFNGIVGLSGNIAVLHDLEWFYAFIEFAQRKESTDA